MKRAFLIAVALLTVSCADEDNLGSHQGVDVIPYEIAGVYEGARVVESNPEVQTRTVMVNLQGGEYFVVRGVESSAEAPVQLPFEVSEIFHGNAALNDSAFSSLDLRYFNLQFGFVGIGRIDAALDEGAGSIVGSMPHEISWDQLARISPRGLYPGPPFRLDSISVFRNHVESAPVTLLELLGEYEGLLDAGANQVPVVIALGETGVITVTSTDGCMIEGSITPTYGAGRIQARSNVECLEFPEVQFSGVIGNFGGRLVAVLVDVNRESALVVYFEQQAGGI